MNKFSKLILTTAATIFTTSAFAQYTSDSLAYRSVPATKQPANTNWVNGTGEHVWMSGAGAQCVRNSDWSPATANKGCDGALVQRAATPPFVPVPTPATPPVIASEKVTYSAGVLFNFDSAALNAVDKAKLTALVAKIKGLEELEVVVVTGYTDEIGSDAYNRPLSLRRAETVKSFIVAQGIDANHVYTEGKGKSSPVMTGCREKLSAKLSKQAKRAQLISCLSPNRRVEIQVVGRVARANNSKVAR
jgi:OOP family OmpA-OmpF porin